MEFLTKSVIKLIMILQNTEKLTRRELIKEWRASETTYVKWVPKLIKKGIIKTEQENTFPFSNYHMLTEKGRRIATNLEELLKLIEED